MDNPIVKRLMGKYKEALTESKDSTDYRAKIEKILKYRLGTYETSVSVSSVVKVGETPKEISFKVEYKVDVNIPVGYDPETGSTDFEFDTEYREDVITLNKEELSESLSSEEGADLVYTLTMLKTEAREALYKYQELEDVGECKAILQHLVKDAQRALDLISKE